MNGNVRCGAPGGEVIIRLEPRETDQALARNHTRIFDFSVGLMQGWIVVGAKGMAAEKELSRWLDTGLTCAGPPCEEKIRGTG